MCSQMLCDQCLDCLDTGIPRKQDMSADTKIESRCVNVLIETQEKCRNPERDTET